MIASPSDISEERKAIRQVIHNWNTIHSENRKIVLLPVEWKTHATPETRDHPQNSLNRQILEPSDLLVGLFWTRLGTPTDEYVSGSAEEINRHVDAGKPAMLYFSDQPAKPSSVDPEQYKRLQKFKDNWRDHALIEEFEDPSDFRKKFDRQLQMKLNQDIYFQDTKVSSPYEEIKQVLIGSSMELTCQRANDFLSYIHMFIDEAKKEIWFVGVNFFVTAPQYKPLLIRKLSIGVNIKFLIFDPLSPSLSEVAKGFSNSEEEFYYQCASTVASLQEIDAAWRRDQKRNPQSGKLEIRLSVTEPKSRFYFFDPELSTGFTYHVPHVHMQDSPNLPGTLHRNEKREIVSIYADGVKKLWEESEKYEDWLPKYQRHKSHLQNSV